MSLSEEQSKSFITPLVGKTTTFLFGFRSTNLAFARAILTALARSGFSCDILDLDALYSSNAATVFGRLPVPFLRSTTISVPGPESNMERDFSRFSASGSTAVVIDSMNTLYHSLSADDSTARVRKLSFAVGAMSYLARAGSKAVVFTMYRREGLGRAVRRKAISSMSDVTALVQVHGTELSFKCERGVAWPGGACSLPAD
jgi:hypothetical protein